MKLRPTHCNLGLESALLYAALTNLARNSVLLLVLTLFFTQVLAVGLKRFPEHEKVIMLPGLVLPSVIVSSGESNVHRSSENSGPGFLCGYPHGQRTAFRMLDGGGARAEQQNSYSILGITRFRSKMVHSQIDSMRQSNPSLPSSITYVQKSDGIGTLLTMLWFEDAGKLLLDPIWAFLFLFPMLLIFSVSTQVTRLVCDSRPSRIIDVIESGVWFFAYMGTIITLNFILLGQSELTQVVLSTHEGANTLEKIRIPSLYYHVTEIVLGLVVSGFTIRALRRPFSMFLVRSGVFVVVAIATNFFFNIVLGASLLLSGYTDMRSNFVEINEYKPAVREANALILHGKMPNLESSPIRHLRNLDEVCPPWARYEQDKDK